MPKSPNPLIPKSPVSMSLPTPGFLYFDFGKVVVDFDVERMIAQMAALGAVESLVIRQLLFRDGLQAQYETGLITSADFHSAVCTRLGCDIAIESLATACADFFELRPRMLPVLGGLKQAGYRLGILSNTCEYHWEHCRRRYRIVAEGFDVHALSYRIGAMKPDPAIYLAAAKLAGCRPKEIFFVDDLPENVAGARAAGFDAELFTDVRTLVSDLWRRGLRFNY